MYFNNEPSKEYENIQFSMSNRQASLLIAAGLLIVFFTFITGYFWGKHNAVSQFCMSVEQSSFADRIYTSMCELSEMEAPSNPEAVAALQEQPTQVAIDDEVQPQDESDDALLDHDEQLKIAQLPANISTQFQSGPAHHAQLAGYGSEQQADKFVKKLAHKGIQARVETKKSKSAKGKMRTWYQVVTSDFTDKKELESLVARISKEEKLSGVQIVRS